MGVRGHGGPLGERRGPLPAARQVEPGRYAGSPLPGRPQHPADAGVDRERGRGTGGQHPSRHGKIHHAHPGAAAHEPAAPQNSRISSRTPQTMPTGTACKGFVGWLFLHPLQNRTNRAILTYIIMQSERREPDVPAADRKIFQPHPQSDHHHGGAGGPAGGMGAVGVFLPHHRPRVGQRRLATAQSAYDAVPRAQGREQRLQDRLDRAHGGAAAAGRGTVPLLWQQAPGQAAAQQAAGGGRGPQG